MMRKKLLSACLALVLCLSLLPAVALAADTQEGGDEPVGSSSAMDSTVTAVQALIDALPTVDELAAMDAGELDAAIAQYSAAYAAYDAMTDELKVQVTGADKFDQLFALLAEPSGVAGEGTEAQHSCTGVTGATALTAAGGTLSAGSYYLAEDITLTENLTISGTVTLCLNGHKLTGNGTGSVITVGDGANFTLCDCNGSNSTHSYTIDGDTGRYQFGTDGSTDSISGGVITGGSANLGGGVYVGNGAQVAMEGGTIAGNAAKRVEGVGTPSGGGVVLPSSPWRAAPLRGIPRIVSTPMAAACM